jgi:organic radical activating enzyme
MNRAWDIDDLVESCKTNKLICFGAGKLAREVLPKYDLAQYLHCFVDNNAELWGKSVTIDNTEVPIYSPDILDSATNAVIFITCTDSASIENQLKNHRLKIFNWNHKLFSEDYYFEYRILATCRQAEYDRLNGIGDPRKDDKLHFESLRDRLVSGNYVIVPQIIFILSNLCTLKCKHCSMLMPHFKEKWELEVADAMRYIANFLRGVDEVISFNLIGGEPLLYKELHLVIDFLQQNEKVKRILLTTNCTIIPSSENLAALKKSKVELFLSDYGIINKMAQLVSVLEKENINFKIHSDQKWIIFGGTACRRKSPKVLDYEYTRCQFSQSCKALLKDKYFSCERAARMHMLGNVYDSGCDYVALSEEEPAEVIRTKIKDMVVRRTANACNHCDAAQADPGLIEAGEQDEEKHRSPYTIMKRKT